jgi:hypothetical protein
VHAQIEGVQVATSDDASNEIRSHAIGETISLIGTRNEEPLNASITLAAHPEIEGAPMVGVVLETVNLDLELPIDLQVDSRNIGGPSAGMMYAITVLDLLTVDDLTKGHRIAGTGTISFDETVGAIGGVRQKVFAARSVGAEYVLVPTDNYEEALTAAGKDIEVVAVANLQDALDFFRASGDRFHIAWTLAELGSAEMLLGRVEEGKSRIRESMEMQAEAMNLPVIGAGMAAVAGRESRSGNHGDALRLMGAVETLRSNTGAAAPLMLTGSRDVMAAGREAIGDVAADRTLAEGRAMSLDEAIAYVIGLLKR